MELWQLDCKVRCRVSGISAFYLVKAECFTAAHLTRTYIRLCHRFIVSYKSNHCATSLTMKR